MAAITTGITVYEQFSGLTQTLDGPFEYKEILVETQDTADTGDTFTITLADWGITNFKSIKGLVHTVNNSVIVLETPTTSVTAGVLTVTLGGSGADNLKRTYLIGGY